MIFLSNSALHAFVPPRSQESSRLDAQSNGAVGLPPRPRPPRPGLDYAVSAADEALRRAEARCVGGSGEVKSRASSGALLFTEFRIV